MDNDATQPEDTTLEMVSREPQDVRSSRRKPLIYLCAGVTCCLAAATVLAITRTQSPEELAINSAPPERSVLTEQVKKQQLKARIVARGNITMPEATALSCKPDASAQKHIFTKQPNFKNKLNEGDVIAAVNGRPLIFLTGTNETFREIKPNVKGTDVQQLQAALKRLNHYNGPENGTFDHATQQAVHKLYKTQGYEAQTTGSEAQSRVEAARQQHQQAQTTLDNTLEELANQQKPPAEKDKLVAETQLTEARAALKKAEETKRNIEQAKVQVRLAELTLAEINTPKDTTKAKAAVQTAKQSLKDAKKSLDQATANAGVVIPFCEIIFAPGNPAALLKPATNQQQNPAGAAPANPNGPSANAPGWGRLSAGAPIITSKIMSNQQKSLKDGAVAKLWINGDDTEPTTGTIQNTTANNTSLSGQKTITIKPDTNLDYDLIGRDIKITIPVGDSQKPVLSVPVSALHATADGGAKVIKVTRNGDQTNQQDIAVRPGVSADGLVEVTPHNNTELAEGDHVRIGGLK